MTRQICQVEEVYNSLLYQVGQHLGLVQDVWNTWADICETLGCITILHVCEMFGGEQGTEPDTKQVEGLQDVSGGEEGRSENEDDGPQLFAKDSANTERCADRNALESIAFI